MAFSNGYIFGFAAVVCVVCSVSVAGVSMSLREQQTVNRVRDEHSNILLALGLPEEGQPPLEGEAIDQAWDKYVEQRFITPTGEEAPESLDLDGDGQLDNDDLEQAYEQVKGTDQPPPLLGVFARVEDGRMVSLAIPVTGVGLWGPINGYLALDPNAREVTGATFFAPKETPGLGAEIMEPPFEDQWVGKSIVSEAGKTVPISVEKACTQDPEHCVDGVSGATITSRGVDEMVDQALGWYDAYLSSLRGA